MYRIRFKDCGTTTVCAASHQEAITVARGLLRRGRQDVVITEPTGARIFLDQRVSRNA